MIRQVTSCDGVAAAGEEVTLSNADAGHFACGSEPSWLGTSHESLASLLSGHDAIGRLGATDNEALRLLKAYVGAIEREPAIENAELQRRIADHLQDLIALALGGTAEAAPAVQPRGLPAARLREAKSYILRHLDRPGLSAARVAAHLGVTPRYVHMLFAGEPQSFAQFLLAERLARAHRTLTAPPQAGETISAIAYAAGFADLSHFNRSFRQRYGCTPSDVRASRPRS
jgi:AraC-like DNA-binding protein